MNFTYSTDDEGCVFVDNHACPQCNKYGLAEMSVMTNELMMCSKCDSVFDLNLNYMQEQYDADMKCPKCGLKPIGGHDPCIANLPGVDYACCGHGKEEGYVKFKSGHTLRGNFDHLVD